MRKFLVMAVCAVAAVVLVSAGICQAQGLTVAFVDFQKFASKSKRAQEKQKQFTDLVNVKREALEKKKQELLSLKDQLDKQGPMLKEETRNAKIKELGIKEMELKLSEKEAQSSLENEQREAQELFRRDISKIIGGIRTQKKLSMVIDAVALLSAEEHLDITDEVVQAYDSQAPAAKPAAAAPKPKPAAPAAAPANKPKAPAR